MRRFSGYPCIVRSLSRSSIFADSLSACFFPRYLSSSRTVQKVATASVADNTIRPLDSKCDGKTSVQSDANQAVNLDGISQSQLQVSREASNAEEKSVAEKKGSAQWVHRPYFEGRENLPRKAAILFMYYGGGYYGLQRNPGGGGFTIHNNQVKTELRTIEDELLAALLKCEAITREQHECPQAMQFQRAARTDKSVSALGNVVTTKLRLDRATADRLNQHLPEQIRVLDVIRTTRMFDAKLSCTHRTYLYFLPTFTLTPFDKLVHHQGSRIDSTQIDAFRDVMRRYIGSHRYHNFTSGKTYEDASARRFIMDVSVSDAFERSGLEFVLVTIKGQSFMLHQIRKMVGLAVAITRGLCDPSMIETARGPARFDVPKIPGLGLALEAVHYDVYNRRYGSDGVHRPVAFDSYRELIDRFRHEMVVERMVKTELSDRVIWDWLKTLCVHTYQPVVLEGQVLPNGVVSSRYSKPLSLSGVAGPAAQADVKLTSGLTD